MAINVDNSKYMSVPEIKQTLINTFKRSAEKTVNDAEYDKTILATIQYCSDATIGQYKIKYQNGYFTAYSKDLSTVYSNGAAVYVLVPGNNMDNRMFITGSATNDNSQKSYVTNLEGDQMFMLQSPNLITEINENIDMLSYWEAPGTYRKVLYNADSDSNIISIDPLLNAYVEKSGGYIRIGGSFKTDLIPARKYGNYGIRVGLKFTDGVKYYDLNTFNMIGTPFDFITYMPQYDYWQIDVKKFKRIESIVEYMVGFPEGTAPDPAARDIFIKDLSFYTAEKVYDSNNDKYVVEIIAPKGTFFDPTLPETSLPLEGRLKVDGNYVSDDSNQNVECYWAKEDASIDTIANMRYNKYTGSGWYCLNTAEIVNKDTTVQSADDLKNQQYTYEMSDTIPEGKTVKWVPTTKISLSDSFCQGRITRIKCVMVYQNSIIPQTIEITNTQGCYLVFNSSAGTTNFYNGQGFTTITAGLFRDAALGLDVNQTLNATYKWVEIDEVGIEKSLPDTNPASILTSYPEWNQVYDNENLSDEAVQTYLNTHPLAELCIERYEYYNKQYQYYLQLEEPTQQEEDKRDICKERKDDIIETKEANIDAMYVEDNQNDIGAYILGPSAVEGEYTDASMQDYRSAEITNVTHYYAGTADYNTYKDHKNTLYNLKVSKINNLMNYKVTAFLNGNAIETKTITLTNEDGASLKYDLQITNGKQGFIYSVGGKAPTTAAGSEHPIEIKALAFKLYDQEGSLLYDSEDPNNEDWKTNITELTPVWSFFNTKNSLIKTNYTTPLDSNDPRRILVKNEGRLVYTLADDFDVNKKENSNIRLEVHYDGETIIAETNFTFAKQGDLGTNGTDMILDIDDYKYENYRSDVLSQPQWSTFQVDENTTQMYGPTQRHLNNAYLYATKCYDDSGEEATRVSDSKYVNLKFADSAYNNGAELKGESYASLAGVWEQNGEVFIIDGNSTWSTEIDSGKANGVNYIMTPSFTLSQSTGQTTTLNISYQSDNPQFAYKPTKISGFISQGISSIRTANNTVRLMASRATNQMDPKTGEAIVRYNYGYYTIPYYYFNCGSDTPQYLDPARHIVVVGGYDQVVYDSAGLNPEYNKQQPFTFYVFDEDNKDITEEVLAGVANGKTQITWDHSPGFSGNSVASTSEIIAFADIPNDKQLYGSYCRYNGNVYKCITRHIKNEVHNIYDADGNVVETYASGQFVPSYWQQESELHLTLQQYRLNPSSTYNSLAASSLFNAWISLYVYYKKSNSKAYEMEALIPINVLCNKYGSEIINGWDGKKTQVEDSYIITNKVAAGVKNADNTFTGITIGESFYKDGSRGSDIGLFGYGHTDGTGDDPQSWARTCFIDANTGLAMFGPSGGSQIILNPRQFSENNVNHCWSRIAGWYLNPNFLYKPLGEGDSSLSYKDITVNAGADITPLDKTSQNFKGSGGMYIPYYESATADSTFIWASSSDAGGANVDYTNTQNAMFRVTWGGKLYAESAEIRGKIQVNEGWFGNETNGIRINFTKDNTSSTLRSYPAWDVNSDNENILDISDYLEEYPEAKLCKERYTYYNNKYTTYSQVTNPTLANRTIIFIGDSYQEGWSNDGQEQVIITSWLDYLITNHGNDFDYYRAQAGGWGFAKPDCQFITLLRGLDNEITDKDSITDIVVEGGYNDYDYLDSIDAAINAFGAYAHEHYPNAVLWIAPTSRSINTHQADADEAHNKYISSGEKYGFNIINNVTDVMLNESYFSPDEVHPNQQGYLQISQVIYNNLTSQLNEFKKSICLERKSEIINSTQNFILYNKNFWVRNDAGLGNNDITVYMNGKIMAREGQIGSVNDNATPDSSNSTLFIEYSYYPRYLPADNQAWDTSLVWDTSQGMTKKYALIHKNFSIDNSGEVYFNGKLYTKSGRIGEWVIDNTKLKSVDGTVEISPSRIKLGAFSASSAGRLEGPNWYITPDGRASFTGNGNTFYAENIEMTGTGELRIPSGSKMYIGDDDTSYLHASNNSSGGWFKGDFTFEDTLNIDRDAKIQFASNASGAMYQDKTGIHMVTSRGEFIYNAGNGNLSCYDLSCNSITVNGDTLESYIRSVTSALMVEAGVLTNSNTPHDKIVTATDSSNIRPYYF